MSQQPSPKGLLTQSVVSPISSPTTNTPSMAAIDGIVAAPVNTSTAMVSPGHIQKQPTIQRNVAPFLNKVYNIVNDPSTDNLIRWGSDGTSFIIPCHVEFAKQVLPRFFKHGKFTSFVRQLNMYGFHKVPHLQQGVLQADSNSEQWEFTNPHFRRNQPDLLLLITRKKGVSAEDKEIAGSIDLQHILDELSAIKKHQMSISNQLKTIQRDNQVLWQETVSARERHQRHQDTIDKILRFLASVFSSEKKSGAIPRKRRYLIGDVDTDYHDHYVDDSLDERPAKFQRQNSPGFDIDEYVNDDVDVPTASLPEILPNADVISPKQNDLNPSTDLAAAIALNDQSKQPMQVKIPEQFSSTVNLQQLQGLQSLINLAQANPNLLNQMSADTLLNSSPAAIDYIHNNQANPPTFSAADATPVIYTNNNLPPNPELPVAPSLLQVTDNITSLTKAADLISQDIDDLGTNIEALAQHLGFDPTKYPGNEDDYVNMDEFLNTYGIVLSAYHKLSIDDIM
ncbi:stress-responsive transcription factor hsf1 [Apophysomyces ossiformis]|uniref:Stress-responsive transcription factor hsf1 n=1 Tax=Apophysomyces ossiformis TaxID=679940 RepID=A0A8H7BGI7_9FUNG|nr:stress-responsive transcription factor hsf1 [Apophysomyces ossiformis]